MEKKLTPGGQEYLFMDGNSCYVFPGDLVYIVVFSATGWRVTWNFAEEIIKHIEIYRVLMQIGLCNGLFKNKEKAEEYAEDRQIGTDRAISKSVFGNILP